jgi:hypothetical protein
LLQHFSTMFKTFAIRRAEIESSTGITRPNADPQTAHGR